MTTTTQTQHVWGALGDRQLWCATFLFMAIVSAFVLGIFVIADALRGIDGYFDTNAADPCVAEAGPQAYSLVRIETISVPSPVRTHS